MRRQSLKQQPFSLLKLSGFPKIPFSALLPSNFTSNNRCCASHFPLDIPGRLIFPFDLVVRLTDIPEVFTGYCYSLVLYTNTKQEADIFGPYTPHSTLVPHDNFYHNTRTNYGEEGNDSVLELASEEVDW